MDIAFKASEFTQFLDYVGYDYRYIDTEGWLSELEASGYIEQVGTDFKSALMVPSVYPNRTYNMPDVFEFIEEFCDRSKFDENRQNRNFFEEK